MKIQEMNKEELGVFLEPLTKLACDMLLAGVLVKNVIKHFTNKGLSFEAAENIVEVGKFKAELLMNNKSK